MKLYLVTIKVPFGEYKSAYVIDDNAESAYKQYRKFLDTEDICFRHERELESITLIAEQGKYPDCKVRLFLKELL